MYTHVSKCKNDKINLKKIQALRGTICQPRSLYPAKLSFNLDEEKGHYKIKIS
jgi:hypothetical protein